MFLSLLKNKFENATCYDGVLLNHMKCWISSYTVFYNLKSIHFKTK